MLRKILILFLLFISVLSSELVGQAETYISVRTGNEPPVIDARFDDPVWDLVEWEAKFTQTRPLDGAEPSQKTAFKILYDDKNIYVAINAFDTEPDKIYRRVARRDDEESDLVSVVLDSYFDKRTGFFFSVSPAGVKNDGIVSEDGKVWDVNYDPIWFVDVAITDTGWHAEMRIPLSQVRFARLEEQVWGLYVVRRIYRDQETVTWPYIPENASGKVHLFGELKGIRGIKPFRRVELLPYTVGQIERSEKIAGNPFAPGHDESLEMGLDGKIGITNNLTLDLTINPDFGQVEADPSEVNLTTFETFFEEKRPFFIEGKNIFDFKDMGGGRNANDGLFYSRRIGRAPQIKPGIASGEYSDVPDNTSILTAMKLTGKTANGLSVGFIEAVTREETADISNGNRREETVEPLTNYFVGRLKKDYDGGNRILGAMFTAVNRKLDDNTEKILNRSAYGGGIDYQQFWKDKTYYLTAKAMASNIRGTEEALQRIQADPTHYFQRPDTDYIDLDSTRTALSGHGGMFQWGKGGNGRVTFSGTTYWRSPGLHLNDTGYLREDDKLIQKFEAYYKIWEPFSVFRTFMFGAKRYFNWNFGWDLVNDGYVENIEAEFKNYWIFKCELRQVPPETRLRDLRGGPALIVPSAYHYTFNLDTDVRKKFYIKFYDKVIHLDDGYTVDNNFSADCIWRPLDNLLLSAKPFYQINRADLQYVRTLDYLDDPRYIMGRLDQQTFGLTFRFDYAISPEMTIQYYGQPFVSAGSYTRFKHITDPHASSYSDRFHEYQGNDVSYETKLGQHVFDENSDGDADYLIPDPDFNFREFRSNLVFRWEYKPGSVAYLVWAQDRSGSTRNGDFAISDDIDALFNIHPRHIFLLKLSYWFSLK
ncbi:DUF5916 domain-containing protein [candidate division KSB1 bacterium]